MGKNVYSLVLNDEVVEAIDVLAYREGLSRSSLINRILAEQVSLSTPESKLRDIFASLTGLMDETFRIQRQPSDSMLSLLSRLSYKYNPTIRYSIELYKEPEAELGRLKVGLRTQNAGLIEALDRFFRFFIGMEQHYLGNTRSYELAPGKFIRTLRVPEQEEQQTYEALGNGIADYVRFLDRLIKLYFDRYGDAAVSKEIEIQYRSYLSGNTQARRYLP